jgi:DNA-binding FrmR family transcriptional regulator
MSKPHKTTHEENLTRVNRIEGQVRGIKRMIEEREYCIDIITQIQAVQAALGAIGGRILRKHIEHCVSDAMVSGSAQERDAKIDELMHVFDRYLRQ